MSKSDTLHRFLIENTAIRGELVHLDASLQAALDRYHYPPVVAELLGQAMAAAALLSATIKFEGSLTIQAQGSGPVRLLVVQCDHQRHLRGLVRWDGEVEAGELREQLGEGRLVVTIDPGNGMRRYQGVVDLAGGSLAAALSTYFQHSEQLATRLWLAGGAGRAAGMLLQHLAGDEEDEDAWRRVEMLGATITDGELLELEPEELLRRLYHEESVRLFEAEPVSFRCTCSRERVAGTLRGLGEAELRAILAEHSKIKVACEFCNHRYEFDAVDVERLLAGGIQPEVPSTRH